MIHHHTPACLTIPPLQDKRLDLITIADLGPVVRTLLASPKTYAGRSFGLASDSITLTEAASILSNAIGEPVVYYPMAAADFAKLPFPGADDLANMFTFYADHPDKVRSVFFVKFRGLVTLVSSGCLEWMSHAPLPTLSAPRIVQMPLAVKSRVFLTPFSVVFVPHNVSMTVYESLRCQLERVSLG